MLTLQTEDNVAGFSPFPMLEPSPYGVLDRHVKSRLNCTYCRKVFSNPSYLKVHEKWHKGELEYKCNVCGRSFRYPSELKKHHTIHTGGLAYKCEKCEKSFRRGQLLNDHMQVVHGLTIKIDKRGPKPFVLKGGESQLGKDLLMNISPSIETTWERDLSRNSSPNIQASWNCSTKNESSWERDLFRNISPSEIMAREDLLQNESRQEITNAFSQLNKDFGISISFPDPDSILERGSFSEESIIELNEEFIDVHSSALEEDDLQIIEGGREDCQEEASEEECEKCLLVKEYERKIALLQHEH